MDKHNQFIRRLRDEYDDHIHQIFGYTFDEFVSAVPGGEKNLMKIVKRHMKREEWLLCDIL